VTRVVRLCDQGSRRRPKDGDGATADEEDTRDFAAAARAGAIGLGCVTRARSERGRGVEDVLAGGESGVELGSRRGDERRGARGAAVRTQDGGEQRSAATGSGAHAHGAATVWRDARAVAPQVSRTAPERSSLHGVLRRLSEVAREDERDDASAAQGWREMVRGFLGRAGLVLGSEHGRAGVCRALRGGARGFELHVRGGDSEPNRRGFHGC
jgi:hypothetical protein